MCCISNDYNIIAIVEPVAVDRLVDVARLLVHKSFNALISHHLVYFRRNTLQELPRLLNRIRFLITNVNNTDGCLVILRFETGKDGQVA